MACESVGGDAYQENCNFSATPEYEVLQVADQTRRDLEFERENIEKLQRTLDFIGNEERMNFLLFFNISGEPNNFVETVKQVQRNLGLVVDGVIGPRTLSQIYLRYYQHDIERLNPRQRHRLDVYRQMQNYRDRNVYDADGNFIRTISVSQKPDAFDDRRYWGGENFDRDLRNPVDNFRPLEGTMFANGVIDLGFDRSIQRSPNTVYIERFRGKHILSMYNELGQCELVTFTSPGDASRGANGTYSIDAMQNTNMHHMSNDLNGAPMSYGINVSDWNILVHSGVGIVTGDYESAGCYRVALGYGSYLFRRVREMGNFTLVANI